jgi:hypothetical protein
MAYDKKTGITTIYSDDTKELERDMFRHFEEVTRQLAQDPNCPPEIIAEHKILKKANKSLDDYEKLIALADQARAIRQDQNNHIGPSTVAADKGGLTMKWAAISLNLVSLLCMVGFFFPSMDGFDMDGLDDGRLFFFIFGFAAPMASLVALTRVGGESWFGLYFKRKALEEKQRIKNLAGQ